MRTILAIALLMLGCGSSGPIDGTGGTSQVDAAIFDAHADADGLATSCSGVPHRSVASACPTLPSGRDAGTALCNQDTDCTCPTSATARCIYDPQVDGAVCICNQCETDQDCPGGACSCWGNSFGFSHR